MIDLLGRALDYFTDMSKLGWGADQSQTKGSGDDAARTRQASRFEPPPDTVLRYLADKDRSVYQGQIAHELGWSAPKTSRVLSTLEDAGDITRHQIGRQKLVSLPGDDPKEFRPIQR